MKVEMSAKATLLQVSLAARFGLWDPGFDTYQVCREILDPTHFSKQFSGFIFVPSSQVHLGLAWKHVGTSH